MSNSSAIPEADLIAGLLARNQTAFGLLYDSYAPSLLGVICKMVQDSQVAERLLEDTFVHIWTSIDQYSVDKGRLYTWLLTITRNTAIHFLRNQPGFVPSEIHSDEEGVHIIENDVVLPTAIDYSAGKSAFQLDPSLKQLIDLLYFGGYTQQEAADALRLPLDTIKTRTHMALIQVKDFLGNG